MAARNAPVCRCPLLLLVVGGAGRGEPAGFEHCLTNVKQLCLPACLMLYLRGQCLLAAVYNLSIRPRLYLHFFIIKYTI